MRVVISSILLATLFGFISARPKAYVEIYYTTTANESKPLIKYDNVLAYDALRAEIVDFHFIFTNPGKTRVQAALLSGEDDVVDIGHKRYFKKLTYDMSWKVRVDRSTVRIHTAVLINGYGYRIVEEEFLINNEEEASPLRWNLIDTQELSNGSLNVSAEAVGYPRAEEYQIRNDSGHIIYSTRSSKLSTLVQLNGSSKLTLWSYGRHNTPISTDIELGETTESVAAKSQVLEASEGQMKNIVITVAVPVSLCILMGAACIGVCMCRKSKKKCYRIHTAAPRLPSCAPSLQGDEEAHVSLVSIEIAEEEQETELNGNLGDSSAENNAQPEINRPANINNAQPEMNRPANIVININVQQPMSEDIQFQSEDIPVVANRNSPPVPVDNGDSVDDYPSSLQGESETATDDLDRDNVVQDHRMVQLKLSSGNLEVLCETEAVEDDDSSASSIQRDRRNVHISATDDLDRDNIAGEDPCMMHAKPLSTNPDAGSESEHLPPHRMPLYETEDTSSLLDEEQNLG